MAEDNEKYVGFFITMFRTMEIIFSVRHSPHTMKSPHLLTYDRNLTRGQTADENI